MTTEWDSFVIGCRNSPLMSSRVISATYTPNVGDAVSITAVWYPGQTLPTYYPDGDQDVSVGRLLVDPDVVTNPDTHDTVTIGSAVWAVKDFDQSSPRATSLQLTSSEQRRLGRAGGRIQR